MSNFLDVLASDRRLIMDGAMGSQLLGDRDTGQDCFEAWNLTNPWRVLAVHQAYVAAGAQVLLTNTFQAHPDNLRRHGCEDRLLDIWQAGLNLARQAAGPDRFVLADFGPMAQPNPDFLSDLASLLATADGVLLETASDLSLLETLARLLNKLPSAPPLLVSFTFLRTAAGRLQTFTGWSPQEVARQACRFPIAALGANCGKDITVADMAEILRGFRQETDLPLLARPNAGTPVLQEGTWAYPHTSQQMADDAHLLTAAGAQLLGGCCGTTPAFIQAMASRAA